MSNRRIDNLREPSNVHFKVQTGFPTAVDAKEGTLTLRYVSGTGLCLFAYHAHRWNMTKLSPMNAKDETIVENLVVKNLEVDKTAKFKSSKIDISDKNLPEIRKWNKSYNDIRSGEVDAKFKEVILGASLAVDYGGTGSSTADGALDNLGGTTTGKEIFTLADGSGVRYIRIDDDDGITTRGVADIIDDIGPSIDTVGTIGTGTWEATNIGVAHGGTGLSTMGGANYILYSSGATSAMTASQTLPSAVQGNITTVGDVTTGSWGGTYETVLPTAKGGVSVTGTTENAVLTLGGSANNFTAEGNMKYYQDGAGFNWLEFTSSGFQDDAVIMFPTATAHNVAGDDITLQAGDTTSGTSDNQAGGHLYLKGGRGKGDEAGGNVEFHVSKAGSSGDSLNAHSIGGYFAGSNGNLYLYNNLQLEGSTNEVTTLSVATDNTGVFTIATTGDGATDSDIVLDADGDISLEAAGGGITLDADTMIAINHTGTTTDTIKGLFVDIDKSGAIAGGQTITTYGLDIDINNDTATASGLGTHIVNYGITLDMVTTDAHVDNKQYGIDITLSGTGTATNDESLGMQITNQDGYKDIKLRSSADTADYCTISTTANGATTIETVDGGATGADLIFDADGAIILDSANGSFTMKNAGTAIGLAKSAYAGMILGYRMIGEDAAGGSSIALATSFAVIHDDATVRFNAPPSGAVEVMVQIYAVSGSNFAVLEFALSTTDTGTYTSLGTTYEQKVAHFDRSDDKVIQCYWTVTGLIPGDTYNYWLAAEATAGTTTLYWGGTATSTYPDFIMKVTALPKAISDFVEYD